MSRLLPAAAVVAADTALVAAELRGTRHMWMLAAYGLAVGLVVVLGRRRPAAAFATAVALALLTGGSQILLLWTAYQAGRAAPSRPRVAVVVGAAAGGLGAQLTIQAADRLGAARVVSAFVVFVLLPLLVGRYLAQHERLVATLDRHNQQLHRERELHAEQERLRERLRIARDMHDSLGHRLSLVSIQAAALEVSDLPVPQREAVRRLAGAARDAVDELHEVLGALREHDDGLGHTPPMEAIGAVVAEFRAAGASVTLRQRGQARPVQVTTGQAAYRVVQEGLTNAVTHAPGAPVTVSVEWAREAVLVTVVNPAEPDTRGGGHGLTGLRERARAAGGLVDHGLSGGAFRLVATLPTARDQRDLGDEQGLGEDVVEARAAGGARALVLGLAVACLMFVLLPAGMLLGAG